MNGQFLSHPLFADDVAILSHDFNELAQMSAKAGLKMNIAKTKWMFNRVPDGEEDIEVQGVAIERVNRFIFLGRAFSLPRDHRLEIGCRIRAGYMKFNAYKIFLTSRAVPMKLNPQRFISVSCLL